MLPFLLQNNAMECNAHKLFEWQREFILQLNLMCIYTAANQVGKTTGLILKCLNSILDQSKWKYYFKKRKPRLIWYFLPTRKNILTEFDTKWKYYLPNGEMKDDPTYGWKLKKDKDGFPERILFNNGVTLQFGSYESSPLSWQASTVDAVYCDEELPVHFYDELVQRLKRTKGQLNMGFTATKGQKLWYNAIEMVGTDKEKFPSAYKRQISMFKCLKYADGTPSHITQADIDEAIEKCSTKAEVDKRVHGRFVRDSGLRYAAFTQKLNVCAPVAIPKDWLRYVGVDWGSGGPKGHPSAITFVAVNPGMTKAYVYDSWKGYEDRNTTAGDVVDRYIVMSHGQDITEVNYDYAAADIGEIASRKGLFFQKANKKRSGDNLLNALFQSGQLKVFEGVGHNDDLIFELENLPEDDKAHDDDQADALRYSISKVPFLVLMQSDIKEAEKELQVEKPKKKPQGRMAYYMGEDSPEFPQHEDGLQEVHELFEVY